MTKLEESSQSLTWAKRIDAALAEDRLIAALPDGPLNTSELRQRITGFGRAIASQAATGAIVAIKSETDRHVIAGLTACLRFGCPVLICDPQGTWAETLALLKHCNAEVFITDDTPSDMPDLPPTVSVVDAGCIGEGSESLAPPAQAATALLVATSGTTDKPKVVALSHENLLSQFAIFEDVYGFDAETRAFNLLPPHHVDGIIRGPLLALWFGAVLLRPRRFSAQASRDVLEDIASYDATHLITVPAMLRILLRTLDPTQVRLPLSMRYILCSADYLEPELWKKAEQDFNVPVVNAYGLSEVVCDALIAGPDEATRTIGSIGVARGLKAHVLRDDGQDCADNETGELAIEGGTVMQGYLNDPEASSLALKDGVFRTGDMVLRRPDGVFVFQGRKKNVVVVGGVTIHPEAVTEVLSAMPGVAEAYAFGHRTETGEALLAAVCPLPDHQLNLDEVYAECRERLSPERQPSRLVLLPQLPRRASGKVDQTAIVQAVAAPKGTSVQDIAASCFGVAVEDISDESSPFNTPGWDSLAHMSFIEMLEETFDFTMSPADVAGLMSISDALEIVEREVG